jgi:hypothetical protein
MTSEASRFLACLDPEATFFTFQTFDDDPKRKDRRLAQVLHGTLAEHAVELKRLNERGAGIFVTINETNGKGRKAENVVRVRAVFVDLDGSPLDPVLHNGHPPHIVTETSPGRWHVYWRAVDVTREEFAGVQKALAARFDGDKAVHDLPRVMRLPGFTHRKGKPFVTRIVSTREAAPYKASDFLSASTPSPEVSAAALRYAGKGLVDEGESEWRKLNTEALRNLSAWVPALFGGAARGTATGGYRVSSKALGRDLQEDLSIAPEGIVDFGVHDMGDAREGKRTPIDTVMENGHKEFLEAVAWLRERLGHTTKAPPNPPPNTAAKPQHAKPGLDTLLKSAFVLQTQTFEPLRWIVPDLLPEGLTLLAGKPKVGKSFLALDVATAVASGGMCLGKQCEQGDVLALCLEDSDRRLQRRLTTMLGAQKEKWPARLEYATDWPRLADGGLDLIRKWIGKAAKPRLVIVDILERVRTRNTNKQMPQYTADYDALAALQGIATEAQLSILVLHHQRKMGAEDLIDTISGTLGLGGAVDAFQILGKDDSGNFLYGRGRDLEAFMVAVQQDKQCRWQVLGPKPEAQASPERGRIVAALAKAGKPMTVDEIAAAVDMKKANAKSLLSKLHFDGEVERVATGLYKLPNPQLEMDVDAP